MTLVHDRDPERTDRLDLAQTARATGRLETFLHAVEHAGLAPALARLGPLTVFAPADEAFAALPAGTVDALLDDSVRLVQVLLYHLSPGVVPGTLAQATSVPTINGESLPLFPGRQMRVDGALVVTADLPAANGIIHVIDRVLLPAMM